MEVRTTPGGGIGGAAVEATAADAVTELGGCVICMDDLWTRLGWMRSRMWGRVAGRIGVAIRITGMLGVVGLLVVGWWDMHGGYTARVGMDGGWMMVWGINVGLMRLRGSMGVGIVPGVEMGWGSMMVDISVGNALAREIVVAGCEESRVRSGIDGIKMCSGDGVGGCATNGWGRTVTAVQSGCGGARGVCECGEGRRLSAVVIGVIMTTMAGSEGVRWDEDEEGLYLRRRRRDDVRLYSVWHGEVTVGSAVKVKRGEVEVFSVGVVR